MCTNNHKICKLQIPSDILYQILPWQLHAGFMVTHIFDLYTNQQVSKAYLISPTNFLTFPKAEKCGAVKQNFQKFTG